MFCALNDIQINIDDQINFQDQMEELKEKYHKAQDAFDITVDWKSVYHDPPSTLPLYTSTQNIKEHVFFNTWKPRWPNNSSREM
jgi:hypothetical protein